MTTIVYNLQAVRTAIAKAAVCAGRSSDEVTLLAVSKTFSHDTIREAYLAGQTNFAENYVQEAIEKISALNDLPLKWHFIGPIQSNKTRIIAESFSWVIALIDSKLLNGCPNNDQRTYPHCRFACKLMSAAKKAKVEYHLRK